MSFGSVIFGGGEFGGSALTLPLPTDLLAAVADWLESDDDVVMALGHDAEDDPRIFSDEARGCELPYLVIVDVSDVPSYESLDSDSSIPITQRAQVQVSVFANGKTESKTLAKLVRNSLNDAPLVFDEGVLLYLRLDSDRGIPEPRPGPGSQVTVYHRALTFSAIVESTM